AHPRHAKIRHFPSFILGSSKFSAHPSGDEMPGSSGQADENYYASGFLSSAPLLDDLFEHPKRLSSNRLLRP
ncbi:MAG: hypothetical protein ACRDL7_15205, partial [Gaiellaceae bacterium]